MQLYRHEEALKLLVHDLRDFQGAETYCYSGGTFIEYPKLKTEYDDLRPELFPRLLGEYLGLEDADERVNQTVILLDRWAQFFDARMVSARILENLMIGIGYGSG